MGWMLDKKGNKAAGGRSPGPENIPIGDLVAAGVDGREYCGDSKRAVALKVLLRLNLD